MTRNQTANVRIAFTLIELMVVIAIIGLLVAMLLPAFGTIRTKARITQAAAQFQSLDTGINMFRGEQSLGGALPPSASDKSGSPGDFQLIANPRGMESDEVRIAGAHLLVHAMIGADVLGTPGFRDFDRDGEWWNDTHGDDTADPPGAYAIDPTTGQEQHTRYGGAGYVDDKMKQAARSFRDLSEQGVLAQFDPNSPPIDIASDELVFIDPWSTPILYYKANPATFRMTADMTGSPLQPGIYRQEDNGIITGTEGGVKNNDGLDFGPGKVNGRRHAIAVALSPDPTDLVDDVLSNDSRYIDSFARFILDPSVKRRPTPVRKDKYLLISAGPDARYGTEDDVTNWQREVQ